MLYHNNKNEKGITLYLAMLLLGTTLSTALFVSRTMVKEFTISREVINSMKAIYVADSAMEFTLHQTRIKTITDVVNLENDTVLNLITVGSYNIPTANCTSYLLAGDSTDIVCSIDAYPITILGTNGCPAAVDTTALNCTRIVAKGSYGSISRAIEIVYPNL